MRSFTRSVVIHGHFYQPPREDPWLEEVEAEPSADPYHDWNARVEAECYRTVVAARIPGRGGRIEEIMNTLRFISFNFGPTLLDWMERAAPRTYRAILEADGLSRQANGGHGNALAQAYHHAILPLASRRDKVTEVRWGVKDFRRRFHRDPAGMWLPETAVDSETLDVLAQEGLAFTIVAPHQLKALPKQGLPGRFRTESGRSIALFAYDGPLAHDVAFGPLLKSAEIWAARMIGEWDEDGGSTPLEKPALGPGKAAAAGPEPLLAEAPAQDHSPRRLVSLATDGETYGHHHRFGEMALAAVIQALRSRPGIRLENYAGFLAHSPPVEEVSLVEATSWSCAHGVERWRSDCGCKMDPGKETQQEWRSGLREAMEWLSGRVHRIFEAEARTLLGDPWAARNEYAQVVTGNETRDEFLDRMLPPFHSAEDRVRAAELLEMERNALRIFTSCGWFFDDLAGIEPLQILRYAARAIDLAGQREPDLEEGFLRRLRTASSNEAPPRDGAAIFTQDVQPSSPADVRVAAGTVACLRNCGYHPAVRGLKATAGSQDGITITQVTTGRVSSLEVEVDGANPRDLLIRVRNTGPGNTGIPGDRTDHTLEVSDLPETFRIPLEELVLQEALDRWVSLEAQAALLAGRETLGEVLGGALVSAIREMEAQSENSIPDPSLLRRIEELALLHTRRGLPIPFDAQTDFHHIQGKASPERGAALDCLRDPLGFVPGR